MKLSFQRTMIKNHPKKMMKSIIVSKNNNVKLSKKNNDNNEIIVLRNDDVKSSFLDDNKLSFQGTMSFLLKRLEPARAKP